MSDAADRGIVQLRAPARSTMGRSVFVNLTMRLSRVRAVTLSALLLLLAACSQSAVQWRLNDVTGHLPDLTFQLTGDNGQPVSAEDLRGKVVLMYFGYTHCPDVCPLTMTHLHSVMRRLGSDADKVRIVFVSVDPTRDTPEVLHQYVQAFDPRAIGVTGSMRQVRALTKAYRVAFDADPPDDKGRYEVAHSSAVFIFDTKGRARLLTTSTGDVEGITHDVRQLLESTS